MEQAAYGELAALEEKHWWFLGRRKIAESLIERARLPKQAEILEVGCGCGGNLSLLQQFGKVYACEMHAPSRDVATGRNLADVRDGTLPDKLPFPAEQRFDLIALFDVLEHIDEEMPALHAIHARLKPGAHALFTVPTYKWLWTHHDDLLHHKRRYTRSRLMARVREAGFDVECASYYQTALFPVLLIGMLREKLSGAKNKEYVADASVPRPFINQLFYKIMAGERFFTRLPLPFGPSLILLARKH